MLLWRLPPHVSPSLPQHCISLRTTAAPKAHILIISQSPLPGLQACEGSLICTFKKEEPSPAGFCSPHAISTQVSFPISPSLTRCITKSAAWEGHAVREQHCLLSKWFAWAPLLHTLDLREGMTLYIHSLKGCLPLPQSSLGVMGGWVLSLNSGPLIDLSPPGGWLTSIASNFINLGNEPHCTLGFSLGLYSS